MIPTVGRYLWGLLAATGAELNDLQLTGPRARQATITALSVGVSAMLAMLAHLDMPWWSAISGFMSVQATRPGSLQRALLRIGGTIAGVTSALMIVPWVIQDHVAGSLLMFAATTLGMTGMLVSNYGYAWLFFAITNNMVVLMSISDPTMALHYAVYRTIEVSLGSLTALLAVTMLGPDTPAPPVPAAPGWSDLLGSQWPHLLHAVRTGITVMLLPWAWRVFELPGLSQMAVTVAAVMAVPVLSPLPSETHRAIADRAVQRVLGCLLGGVVALVALASSFTTFSMWIGLLATGVWVGSQVQASTRGAANIGIQATIVWIMMLVQGWGPPNSIMPGVNRFAGILSGLTILLTVSLLLWPVAPRHASDPDPLVPHPP